jgi:hypothetical protein
MKRSGIRVSEPRTTRITPQSGYIRATLAYEDTMNYKDIITVEPDKRGGKPCIRGLRITVCAGISRGIFCAGRVGTMRGDAVADFVGLRASLP